MKSENVQPEETGLMRFRGPKLSNIISGSAGDTLFFDEYFTYPSGTKWAFDNVGVTLRIPEGTVVHMDINTENIIHPQPGHYYDTDIENSDNENRFWKLTEEGFRLSDRKTKIKL